MQSFGASTEFRLNQGVRPNFMGVLLKDDGTIVLRNSHKGAGLGARNAEMHRDSAEITNVGREHARHTAHN